MRDYPVSRMRVLLHGAVQGVGFRPFVFRLAREMGLSGWTGNSVRGLEVEVEGAREKLEGFLIRLSAEKPPRAVIQGLEYSILDPAGFKGFDIRRSNGTGEKTALILPDIAVCDDCLRDIFEPGNRRYRYPFTNCTNCGPRFSIVTALPYDRANTTMSGFPMCAECRAEYEEPSNRRFHAQPNACAACGPRLELWDSGGGVLERGEGAISRAVSVLRAGGIAAVKGLGGFHVLADARDAGAVRRLRTAKEREEKPFAVMYPTLEEVKLACEVSVLEERALVSPESPIVLLEKRKGGVKSAGGVCEEVAPGNPRLGVMLPYTPLHHLLLADLGFPVVATSGNFSEEPIVTDEHEAVERLKGIAEVFLVHNRPIARPVDDSVVEVVLSREFLRRRARGYAPMPIGVADSGGAAVLALGAHLKNAVAVSAGRNVFLSAHVGDLETPAAIEAFRRTAADLASLYGLAPQAVACDLHPDFPSTKLAEESGLPLFRVQHHWAHVLSCAAENQVQGAFLGVSWDGTGWGTDGTVWGGEFLTPEAAGFKRFARLGQFRLPGSEAAVREPRRSALGVLHSVFGEAIPGEYLGIIDGMFGPGETKVLIRMLERGVNSPLTSSAGRLFDAVAAILGLCVKSRFEGQAAMALEFAVDRRDCGGHYDVELRTEGGEVVVDWGPLVLSVLKDRCAGAPVPAIAARFHNSLVSAMVKVALKAGLEKVVLSGGCFQNRFLLENSVSRLAEEGFRVYWHQRVPTNDGGIALGQAVAAFFAEKRG